MESLAIILAIFAIAMGIASISMGITIFIGMK